MRTLVKFFTITDRLRRCFTWMSNSASYTKGTTHTEGVEVNIWT